jgi:hypothetical protein
MRQSSFFMLAIELSSNEVRLEICLRCSAREARALDHFESMSVSSSLLAPRRVLLIDDFVTRGATLIGAASRIRAVLPDCEVLGFALVRSMTDGEITTIRDPCVGSIELKPDGESARRP